MSKRKGARPTFVWVDEVKPGAFGCDVPGHPNNHSHDCAHYVDDGVWRCAAGRSAFLGGRWKLPCFLPTEHHHVIVAPGRQRASQPFRIELCDTHFAQANERGHVTDPFISEEAAEYQAKQARLADPPPDERP